METQRIGNLENLELLCYNCYFLNVGNVWSDNQLQQMEDYNQKEKINSTTIQNLIGKWTNLTLNILKVSDYGMKKKMAKNT